MALFLMLNFQNRKLGGGWLVVMVLLMDYKQSPSF